MPSSSLPFRAILGGLSFLLCALPSPGQEPPDSFTRVISTSSQSVRVDFQHFPIRNANFQVLVQQADGTYLTHAPEPARTYLGTVQGHPGAIACGLLRADNSLWARVSFEDGSTWTTTGGTATASSSPFTPQWPTTEVAAGGAGANVFAAELGIDSTNNHYLACGGKPDLAVAKTEFSVLSSNMVYLRDASITHRLGKIVLRADAAQDPYAPDGGDTSPLLNRVKSLWNTGTPMGTSHQIAAVIHSQANGGLAWVGSIGTSNRYSANDSDSWGDFSGVWRHEAGHNWGASHYEGGGNPEGNTIMSNNALSRFSSSELVKIISHRNSRTGLANLGPFHLPVPPRANQVRASFYRNTSTRIDPLYNDSDANGDAISLHSFDSTTAAGGALSRSTGTGPGGRDEIIYTPPAMLKTGTDWFRYRIQDSSGQQAVGFVMLRPRAETLALADRWTLDEGSGATTAANLVRTSHNGSHENGVLTGQSGAAPGTLRGAYYDGSNDRTRIPAPNYNTNTLTFTAWVRRSGSQNSNAGLVFSRSSSTSGRGLQFGSGSQLAYNWGNSVWNSGLVPPDDTWCLAALSITPTTATIHLRTPAGLQSATRNATHSSNSFSSPLYLGWDSGGSSRYFRGWLDDVRAWTSTLTADDIESLYLQAVAPPQFALTSPGEGDAIPPLGTLFSATVGSLEWAVDRIDYLGNGNEVASTTTFPWLATATNLTPGELTTAARALYGDWGYQAETDPVSLTVLPAPLPVVTVAASMPASFRGPVPGTFTITRSHGIGSVTVPFAVAGSAAPGTDYAALPNSISFNSGELAATLTVNPVEQPPGSPSKAVTLSLSSGPSHDLGTPSAATLSIDDHITSVADGGWNAGETWNSRAPAPTSGTQNSGTGYAVAHTVTSNNTGSNSQALVAGYLRVKNGGTLDLARLHAATVQNASYNLPATTVEDGGTILFRASVGSSVHTVAVNLVFAGNSTLRLNGGSYENKAVLSGIISGSGLIELVSDSGAGAITADLRQISITRANNPYAGDWSVTHTPSGDDFAALRAAASNALGSGTVTVGRRSHLINDNSTGLNSLAGVVLNGDTSLLALNQPWTNPAATLALTGGSPAVQLGNAPSQIGNLSGTAGSITGSGASSNLVVNQTIPAQFGGVLGPNLTFTKSGPAFLGLLQAPHPGLRLALQEGTLALPEAAVTVASLHQTGGTLRLDLPGAGQSALMVSGNITRTSGVIEVTLPESPPPLGVPFTLVSYQGALSGQPEISFTTDALAMIDYGSGSNSAITATFYELHDLTVVPSHPERGEVSGGGPYPSNTSAAITATAAPGWRFVNWSGNGIADPSSPSTTVLVDAPKTVTANFDRPLSIWVQPVTGGSWSDAANWNILPVFMADEWLDFSTLDLTAAHTNTLDGNRGAGGLRFADAPTASHDWIVAEGSGGTLTLATTTGLPPEIEVLNRAATLSAALAGSQGLTKSGAGTLVLNHPANTLAGPIAVDAGILQICDGGTNTPTVFDSTEGRPITVGAGAILDLPRLHAFTVQTVIWSLPTLHFDDEATLRFRASTGSNSHHLAAPLTVAGHTTIHNNGGAYAQDIYLTGTLAGGGTIHYLATTATGAATTTRTLTLSNPANAFTGDWFIDYTAATTDDFVALRSTAAGALGSGSVTLDRRARLIAGAANSLDSITGITLLKPTSFADLHPHGWNQPTATLTIEDGTVDAGSAAVTFGTLTQSGGALRLTVAEGAPAPVVVTGNAAFTGGEIEVTVAGNPAGKTFQVLRYQGALTGMPVLTFAGIARTTPTIDWGSGTDDVIAVTFPTETGASLVWRGNDAANPNHWDVATTANWTNNGEADSFLAGDNAIFNDTAASYTPALQGAVSANTVTFDHSASDYTLAGPGSLAAATLVKRSAGTTTISSANTFTGPVAIHEGRLRLANAAALGDSTDGAKTVTIHPGGQLDLNGYNHTAPSRSYTLDIAGEGPDETGALVNNAGGIASNAGVLHLVLSGDASIGGTGRFDIGWVNGNPAQGTITGNGHTLTKTGTNPIMLRGDASATPIQIIVAQGILGAEDHDAALGGATGHVTVRDGAVLGVWGERTLVTPVTLEAGATLRAMGGGAGTWSGPVTLAGDASVDLSGQAKTISGAVSGGGALTKTGGNTLTLSGDNSYTGDTTLAAGTLVLTKPFLADASAVRITTGAALDLAHAQADTIAELWIDGIQQVAGTYDSGNSGFITGAGALLVTGGPATTPYEDWLIAAGLVPGTPGTGPDESADGSGVPNLLQFGLGGNPVDAHDNGVHIACAADGRVVGASVLLTIAAPAGAVFSGGPSPSANIAGIIITVTGSGDLASWDAAVEEVTPAFDGNGAVAAPAGYQLHTFRLGAPLSAGDLGFLRIAVAAP